MGNSCRDADSVVLKNFQICSEIAVTDFFVRVALEIACRDSEIDVEKIRERIDVELRIVGTGLDVGHYNLRNIFRLRACSKMKLRNGRIIYVFVVRMCGEFEHIFRCTFESSDFNGIGRGFTAVFVDFVGI